MTPNPTARPFVVGALLFLTLISLWPSHVSASGGAPAAPTRFASPAR
jgi:hypothetical protein